MPLSATLVVSEDTEQGQPVAEERTTIVKWVSAGEPLSGSIG